MPVSILAFTSLARLVEDPLKADAAEHVPTEVDPLDVAHEHRCIHFPACDGTWQHTPRQSWEMGRWESHECPKCKAVQFKPTQGEHDVDS